MAIMESFLNFVGALKIILVGNGGASYVNLVSMNSLLKREGKKALNNEWVYLPVSLVSST